MSPPAIEFRYPWKRLNDSLIQLGVRQSGSLPLCVVFEFDERDALVSYEKYVSPKLVLALFPGYAIPRSATLETLGLEFGLGLG